jgi:hypothetical protein
MALQYVTAYGKITRKEAAELCKISSTQARDLLSRLVKKGILEMHGSKKGAYYVDASKNMDKSKMDLDVSKKGTYLVDYGILLNINILCFYRIPPRLQMPLEKFYVIFRILQQNVIE